VCTCSGTRASFAGPPVLHARQHGQAGSAAQRIFKEIHVNGNPLVAADPNNSAQSERIQTTFVEKFGISAAEFGKAYHQMPVDLALQRADELVQRYRVDSVPKFVVNGKYVADVSTAGSRSD